MLLWTVFLSVVLATCAQDVKARSKLVRTSSGPVRGYEDPDGGFFVFYGIPYAKAPTGVHKFKAPLPAPVWFETFEAVDRGIMCPQVSFMNQLAPDKKMQEDCLIANIYVPDTNEVNLPVVVYVHGGAYILGFGEFAKPLDLIKSKKVIVVNFNYRLGAHGFLCLGTVDVPGNAGMKDQVALLRWVNRNIASFGGNPDDVTIAGYSAGSSSVDLLMLSRITRGLFHKVIPESGANTAAFSVQNDPVYNARMYAKMLNYTNIDDFYALQEFYKTATYEVLTAGDVMQRKDSTFVFSPCVERSVGEERFLTDVPANLLMKNKYAKVPMLYGFANMEGLLRIQFFDDWKDKMNTKFSDFLTPDLYYGDEKEKEELAQEIKKFYFGDKPVSEEYVLEYVNFFTDIIFAYPTLWSIKLHLEGGHDKIYLYEYSYTDENTPVVPHTDGIRGANHCAQSVAIQDFFNIMPNQTNVTEEYKKHKELMIQIWLNFILTGNPVPEGSDLPVWPPVGPNSSPHMSLGNTMELRGSLLPERTKFWDKIFSRHYRLPIAPPEPPAWHTEL